MDDKKIIELYQSGKSCQEIAAYCNCTSQCISKKLRKLNVSTRQIAGYYTPKELQELREQIAVLRLKNLTFKEIGKIVNLSATSVWEHSKHLEQNHDQITTSR